MGERSSISPSPLVSLLGPVDWGIKGVVQGLAKLGHPRLKNISGYLQTLALLTSQIVHSLRSLLIRVLLCMSWDMRMKRIVVRPRG